ncbi:Asp-tRNA(Asn)/Glu-tRNA(Gln) amidotransferase subunit GatB, partial [SAR202 cluster bacterium AD-802-E10_MRT_200m]|nr:Asp-tRNA(Asn)/Glu-tRNA(Gln) amidotransferase subunit GatB [SAR202 cluster bacterium AD-802-E10_MRT_200m]
MELESVIGLEVHAQLFTNSKMFCSCRSGYVQGLANTRVCPICLGMPGSLPVINRQAVEFVMMTGLALNCEISAFTQFDRKNYPYPDLMKGYQISQYLNPIAFSGWVDLVNAKRTIGITRVHLEEDVAKLQHVKTSQGQQYSLVDVNRSGVPLMETVSEPDIRSPEEAHEYLTQLHSILQFLGVSTADMQNGAFRCDANISLRPKGTTELQAKVEVKNMNSFRSVYQALEFEIARQTACLETGQRVIQETRGWNEEKQVTVSQRTKEFAHDYRYFPEPDLPPVHISEQWVSEVKGRLPELPAARRQRYILEYNLSEYDASLLTNSKSTSEFFEATLDSTPMTIEADPMN